jgi:flagellin-like protein
MRTDRAASPVVATVLMVAIVFLVAGTLFVAVGDVVEEAKDTNEKPIPVSDDLLVNGDFESSDSGAWEDGLDRDLPQGDARVTTEAAVSGSYGLELGGNPEFVGQDVSETIEPGRTYRACARTRIDDPSAKAYFGVQFYDDEDPAGATILKKETYQITWTSVREQCVYVEFPPNAGVESAEVWLYRGNAVGTVVADDVSLVKTRYLADPDERTG